MKKLPYGISDYEKIVDNEYYYVDKTSYLEKLENLVERYIYALKTKKIWENFVYKRARKLL